MIQENEEEVVSLYSKKRGENTKMTNEFKSSSIDLNYFF